MGVWQARLRMKRVSKIKRTHQLDRMTARINNLAHDVDTRKVAALELVLKENQLRVKAL